MVTWIGAFAGVLAAAYFGGIALNELTQSFASNILSTAGETLLRRRAIFFRVFSTSWLAVTGILIISIDADLRHSLGTIWLTVAATAILAFVIPGPVTITPDGLLRKNNFRKDTLIRWDVLDHYEIKKGAQGMADLTVSDVYYFRAQDGRTIKVNDWTQDGHNLLSNIRQHKTLPERPFNPTDYYNP